MNLQESIKRILKEETKRDKMIDKFITLSIMPEGRFKQEYNHQSGRLDISDSEDNLVAAIFYNKRREAMEVLIDESIWAAISNMFSMETWDEVNDALVNWFQDNFDGLEELYEVNTFDNYEYVY